MTTAYAPPDLEGAAVALLSDLADSVSTRLPRSFPDSLIRVTRAGGGSRNLIQTDPRLLVECWARDGGVAAFDLARMAYGRMWAAADSFWTPGVFVTRVDLDDPVNFPDPDAQNHARYQFLGTLTVSLTEVTA